VAQITAVDGEWAAQVRISEQETTQGKAAKRHRASQTVEAGEWEDRDPTLTRVTLQVRKAGLEQMEILRTRTFRLEIQVSSVTIRISKAVPPALVESIPAAAQAQEHPAHERFPARVLAAGQHPAPPPARAAWARRGPAALEELQVQAARVPLAAAAPVQAAVTKIA